MSFDVPKVVRSPGCDHGHDEESRNGRDIKIDILEAYVLMYRRLFGVPDMITDMTRSLQMVET